MKILHLISSGGMYGAEAVILNLSSALRRQGHESSIGVLATASGGHLQLHEAAARQNIPSHLVPCRGALDRRVLKCLRGLVAATGAEVIHLHGYKADVYGFLALRGGPATLVSTCHTWYDNDLALRLYGLLDRLVLRRFAQVAAVSNEVRQQLLRAGVKPEKVRLIRNGVDLSLFTGVTPTLVDEGEPLVGLVGRLAPEKGVDLFLRAAADVLQRLPRVRLIVVGEGADRALLETQIDELNLRGKVRLLGRRDDMAGVYASLTVLVSASRQEGLPVTILEAMASSVAIVATDAGEVPALILDGETGLLVAMRGAPEATVSGLAEAIMRLIEDEPLRSRLGSAARERVEARFSARQMTADYLAFYQAALGRTG